MPGVANLFFFLLFHTGIFDDCLPACSCSVASWIFFLWSLLQSRTFCGGLARKQQDKHCSRTSGQKNFQLCQLDVCESRCRQLLQAFEMVLNLCLGDSTQSSFPLPLWQVQFEQFLHCHVFPTHPLQWLNWQESHQTL